MADIELNQSVLTPQGKVQVPVDRSKLETLMRLFTGLSVAQQDFLITRFPHCNTDKEAVGLLSCGTTDNMVDHWKRSDPDFKRCYDLLASRLIDWAGYLASDIEAGNALLGALENRKLLLRPWEDLGAREATAKAQAANQALDRIVGKKTTLDVHVVRVEDIIPKG